ncbi:MAG: hypothetical protein KAZ13_01810, partial [Desulfobulbus sp.]|nr:hypothetical protein [Desulfobulbus sp.]
RPLPPNLDLLPRQNLATVQVMAEPQEGHLGLCSGFFGSPSSDKNWRTSRGAARSGGPRLPIRQPFRAIAQSPIPAHFFTKSLRSRSGVLP